jgi:ferritin
MEIKKFGTQTQAQAQLEPQAQSKMEGGIVKPNVLPEIIEKMINDRIGDEYTAHYFYRNAANWCKNMNYKKAASFFEAEASSELDHAKGLQDYLTQWNLLPVIPQAPTTKTFNNLVEIVGLAYQMEYGLFGKYSEGQKSSLNVHPATFNFIQGYVNIQNDAVAEYSDLLNAIMLVNHENKFEVLYFEQTYF